MPITKLKNGKLQVHPGEQFFPLLSRWVKQITNLGVSQDCFFPFQLFLNFEWVLGPVGQPAGEGPIPPVPDLTSTL